MQQPLGRCNKIIKVVLFTGASSGEQGEGVALHIYREGEG